MTAREAHWFDSLESTNTTARSIEFRHGDIIATLNQTAGRGRLERTWEMSAGDGVAFTIVFEPFELGFPRHLSRTPLVAALALADEIGKLNSPSTLSLKWPNDVLLDNHKVAGILVEDLGRGRFGVGIGVNLESSPSLEGVDATSLAEAGASTNPQSFVVAVATRLFEWLSRLDETATLDVLDRRLDTIGRPVLVELPDGRAIHGVAIGLAESGALLVETEGFVTELPAGDVTHLRYPE